MDIILIAVEFGSHKIRSSRVLYSVIVKVSISFFILKILHQLHSNAPIALIVWHVKDNMENSKYDIINI